jgi:hypothetical protein
VLFRVGPEKQLLYAHKQLLCARSPYFKRLIREPASDPIVIVQGHESGTVSESETFSEFLNWLYRDKVFETTKEYNILWLACCKLWVLAAKFEVPDLQNKVMYRMILRYQTIARHQMNVMENWIKPAVIEYVYNKTKKNSALRRFIIDAFAFGTSIEHYNEVRDGLPVECITDLSVVWMTRAKGPGLDATAESAPFLVDKSPYYVFSEALIKIEPDVQDA